MPFGSYDDLRDTVADYLVRPDLANQICDFIYLAEIRVAQDMNLLYGELTVTGNLVADQDYITLPADCLEPKQFTIDGSDPIRTVEIVPRDIWEEQKAHQTGGLVAFAYVAGVSPTTAARLYLAGAPTAADAYKLVYQSGPIHLSPTSTTNNLLRDRPNLLLYGALIEAESFLKNDEAIAKWAQLYGQAKTATKKQDYRMRTGGGPLRVRPDSMTP